MAGTRGGAAGAVETRRAAGGAVVSLWTRGKSQGVTRWQSQVQIKSLALKETHSRFSCRSICTSEEKKIIYIYIFFFQMQKWKDLSKLLVR